MKIIHFLIAFLPPFISNAIRKLLGYKIGKGTKIGYGSVIIGKNVVIGSNSRIGLLTLIQCETINIGNDTHIGNLCMIKTLKFMTGNYVIINSYNFIVGSFRKESSFEIGDHSAILNFCWIEPGQGIKIGKRVGVGGFSLLFTHGDWSDYLKGGPKALGPIEIEDNVWLPWRVFILPNVKIGKDAILGGNSLINKSIPANCLAGGSPAKIIKENILYNLTTEEIELRVAEIIDKFIIYNNEYKPENNRFKVCYVNNIKKDELSQSDIVFFLNEPTEYEFEKYKSEKVNILVHSTYTLHIFSNKDFAFDFAIHIGSFGVRLDRILYL